MKKHINTRIELLLAKIAGRNVDLSTMTPPVAMNLTEELMLDIADRMDDASSELPAITADDNGDILTVVEGTWAKAAPPASGIPVPASPSNGDVLTYNSTSEEWEATAPSGGGAFVVTISGGEEGEPQVLDKNWNEINTAFRAGQIVVAVIVRDTDPFSYASASYLASISNSDIDEYSVNFGSTTYSADTATGALTSESSPK